MTHSAFAHILGAKGTRSMRTRLRLAALAGIFVGGLAPLLVAPSPAAATDLCAFQGTATTGPLYYPVTVDPSSTLVTVRQAQTVGFGFTVIGGIGGVCLSTDGTLNKQLVAGGTLTGWCGHSSGQGTANNGRNFAWVGVGGLLVVTGHVTGVVYAAPNTLAGESCLNGSLNFLLTGVVALTHCTLLTSTLINVPVPETLGVVIPGLLSVHTSDLNYHLSVCVPSQLP